jgi:putative transposase
MSKNFPYHVTARSNNREWFALDPEKCWHTFSNFLFFSANAFGAQIHAFVLMSNHFHLLISTPNADLATFMNRFMTETSVAINDQAMRANHVFGGRYKGCLIDEPYYYANAMKYVYRNPVAAGIVKRVEDYKFSTLHGLIGFAHMTIPILPFPRFEPIMAKDIWNRIEWFNSSFDESQQTEIARNLHKTVFSVSAKQTSNSRYLLGHALC